jgi:hypothetical protein
MLNMLKDGKVGWSQCDFCGTFIHPDTIRENVSKVYTTQNI